MIKRTYPSKDRREVSLALTAKGRKRYEDIKKITGQIYQKN